MKAVPGSLLRRNRSFCHYYIDERALFCPLDPTPFFPTPGRLPMLLTAALTVIFSVHPDGESVVLPGSRSGKPSLRRSSAPQAIRLNQKHRFLLKIWRNVTVVFVQFLRCFSVVCMLTAWFRFVNPIFKYFSNFLTSYFLSNNQFTQAQM